jgi:NADH:ubiquinone oxidoreductase subunit 6 (subunit J)
VYVGGTLVLVVFGVMLTAQGPFISMKTGPAEWAFATIVGLLFLGVLTFCALTGSWPAPPPEKRMSDPRTSPSGTILGEALLGLEQATPEADLTGLPANAKNRSRTRVSYLLPFEIVSVHLLVVLIGAAYLARAKRRQGAVS